MFWALPLTVCVGDQVGAVGGGDVCESGECLLRSDLVEKVVPA